MSLGPTEAIARIPIPSPNDIYSIAASNGAVWVGTGDVPGVLDRIDPETNQIVARVPLFTSVLAIAAGNGTVWAHG